MTSRHVQLGRLAAFLTMLLSACGSKESNPVLPALNKACDSASVMVCPETLRGDEVTEYFWDDEPIAFRFVVKNNTGKVLSCSASCVGLVRYALYSRAEVLYREPSPICTAEIRFIDVQPGDTVAEMGYLNMSQDEWVALGSSAPNLTVPIEPGSYEFVAEPACSGLEADTPTWNFKVIDSRER